MSGQMYQQQVHQAMQQGAPSHLAYQGQQQQQHFSENPAYTDSGGGTNAGSMPCHYQNYQVGQPTAFKRCRLQPKDML